MFETTNMGDFIRELQLVVTFGEFSVNSITKARKFRNATRNNKIMTPMNDY